MTSLLLYEVHKYPMLLYQPDVVTNPITLEKTEVDVRDNLVLFDRKGQLKKAEKKWGGYMHIGARETSCGTPILIPTRLTTIANMSVKRYVDEYGYQLGIWYKGHIFPISYKEQPNIYQPVVVPVEHGATWLSLGISHKEEWMEVKTG